MVIPHDFTPILAVFFRAVLQASWQGALAIALVLLARRMLGVRVPARWHYLLWFLVLARLLVPTVALPHSPASLENIPAIALHFERPPIVVQSEAPTAILAFPSSLHRVSARSDAGAETITHLSVTPSEPTRFGFYLVPAAWVWIGGVIALGGWLAACVAALHRRLRRETFPVEEGIAGMWRACCQRWLRRTPPRLLAAEWVDSPALVGCWRPILLVPRRSLDSFTGRDWEHVFAHEIAHLRSRDHWSQLLVLAACCVHWFNPVVWLGFRRLRADRELAADEWVLRHLENERALAYGETLFKTLAQRPARFAFQPGMVGISEDGAQMKQRLRRIVAFLPQRRLHGSLAGLAALLALATVVLGQSTLPSSNPPATPATPAAPAVLSPDSAVQQLADAILTAAHAGDRAKVNALLHPTAENAPYLGRRNTAQMLDETLRNRDLPTFTVLLDALYWNNSEKDWKLTDPLLASLVADGRTDFLDVLLARSLDPARLGEQAKAAARPTAEWIAWRVEQETRRGADTEALELAADHGDLPAMSRLVDGGADVNGVGKDDNTPLIRAVFKDRLDAARWLLDHGAQVDKPRFPGCDYTPLCLVNSVPMAELLKKNGANVQAKLYGRDVSILTYAASFAGADVVEWFLRQGLDPKMKGDGGKPNLLFELKDGRTAALLLDAGLDPNQTDRYGYPPVVQARSGEVAQALIDHGAKVTGFATPLLPMMVQFTSAGAMEAVLKAGADQDGPTLQAALDEVDRMYGRDSSEKDAIRRVLLAHGAKPGPAQPALPYQAHWEGTVSVADGALVDYETARAYHWEAYGLNGGGGSSSGTSNVGADGSVDFWIREGATTASYAVAKEGYAAVYAGPFTPPAKEKVDGIHFSLTKGLSAGIVVADEAGRPIAGAHLRGYYPGPPKLDLAETVTDASGSATIEHVGEASLNIRVLADGFQADEMTGLHPEPAKALRWTLKPAQALRGTVVAASDGTPIVGAVIKLGAVRGTHDEVLANPKLAPVLATTDAQGRFALTSLRADSRYYLFVDAPGYGGAYHCGVTLAQGELDVVLGGELFVRGRIIHAPASTVHLGKVYLHYDQTFRTGDKSASQTTESLYLTPVGGEADFSVGPFYKVYGESGEPDEVQPWNSKPVDISVDSQARANFSIDELPISNFIFDLAGKPSDRQEANTSPEPAADTAPSQSPSPAAPLLPDRIVVTPTTRKTFQGTDGIEVREITGTATNFQVDGTYRIRGVCRQQILKNATLYLGNTAPAGPDAIAPAGGSSLYKTLATGDTEFDFTFKLLRPGVLHLTIYDLGNQDKNDNAYAGIELGEIGLKP